MQYSASFYKEKIHVIPKKQAKYEMVTNVHSTFYLDDLVSE